MALFEMSSTKISGLQRMKFGDIGLIERSDLQRLLRDHIEVISPDTLVISEEFSNWDRSDQRIDLLGVDRQARLVVELKRTTVDSLADLQALRYTAMVSNMTFDEAVETIHASPWFFVSKQWQATATRDEIPRISGRPAYRYKYTHAS